MTPPDELRRLATRLLGPASSEALADWEYCYTFGSFVGGGMDGDDAVLALAFEVGKSNRAVQGEFLSYFKDLLMGAPGAPVISPTGTSSELAKTDLMQSVVGDLLPGYHSLYFNSRAQFLSLFQQRLRWKRLDRLKSMGPISSNANEELDQAATVAGPDGHASTPLTKLLQGESESFLALAIGSLSDADRRLIRAVVDGESRSALAEELGITNEALRQRLRRARAALEQQLSLLKEKRPNG